MKPIRHTSLLLKPSFASLLACFSVAGVVLITSMLLYTSKNGLLYEYMFGKHSSAEMIQSSANSMAAFSEAMFNNAALNDVLFFVFWMLLGCIVYLVLAGFGFTLSLAGKTLHELHYVNIQRKITDDDPFTKVALRSLVILMWFVYSVFFFKILLPFSILSGQIGISNLYDLDGWLYVGLAFAVLIASLHLHVVLLRLLMLRPRVFGGSDDMLVDRDSSHSSI
ncbi:MAG: hypothetical protein JWL85_726 [Candidatus Saccharibacteria bacterium]|nr:hypothetical protein [Candidatus Saccharibacteria bacterium]